LQGYYQFISKDLFNRELFKDVKILKIGGSVITNKDKYRSVNREAIVNIAKVLGDFPEPLILVHGAGSFGHNKSLEFGLDMPGKVRGKEIEISIVINDVLSLNSIISDALAAEGFRGVSLPTHAIYSNNGPDLDIIEEMLRNTFSPILYGDIIIQKGNYRIISGDEIILDMARKFRPEEIIFATDVDGLYSSDPKEYSNAKFYRDVKASELNIKDKGKDATGSMTGKVEKIKLMLPFTRKVMIVNGMFPERLRKALNDEDTIGTVVH